uniref:Reverse transcriptase Ty1/copia-type domain-containing protein n=1 Tax=Vitis vinifera TaxID=29760 RepID=A5BZH7_VITVI|nr:hypothetical protein VITISV_007280 [Vitis vinifera]
MATLKEDTVTLSKLASPYSPMSPYLSPFGLMHSQPRLTTTTVSDWIPPVITILIPSPAQLPSYTPEIQAPDLAPAADHISNTFPPPHQLGPTLQPEPASQQVSTPAPHHSMTTRAKNHITKPIQKLNLHTHLASFPSSEPTSVAQALKDSNWCKAMSEEYDALVRNGTWELVSPTGITNLVGCKWVFRIKRNSDGSIDRFKACLVAKGFHQRPGVDYLETFSPVIKPTTMILVLSIAVSNGWSLRQLDVNNAFLQGTISETVYMAQPPGFIDADKPTHVCKLHKAIYGLKQAPRTWYHELCQFLVDFGFKNSHSDTSLFVLHAGTNLLYLLVYVDDIIITGNSDDLVSQVVECLAQRFSLKDLGPLSYFLGVEVVHHRHGLLLSQRRYIKDLLTRTNMQAIKPIHTPLPTSSSFIKLSSGSPLSDPTKYRTVVGNLQFVSLTRSDISFAVNKMSQFMHQPTDEHWTLVKRILCYLSGTINDGLLLHRTLPLSLHAFSDSIHAFSDADWAEYHSIAATAAELCWVCSLLSELCINLVSPPIVYCDNVGATQLSSNLVFHSRMKHMAVDYHFLRDQVQSGALRVAHVSSADQLVDLLTKPLPHSQFQKLRVKIGLFPCGLS